LLAAAEAGAPWPEGHWLVADRQSAGRGRLGREWRDGAGNYVGSVTVHLRSNDPPAHSLALLTAIAVHDAPYLFGAPQSLVIKWPNDLLVDGAKLAGILLERVGDHVVIGVGINLAQAPEIAGRQITSLTALGCPMDRDVVADTLAGQFMAALADWRGGAWPDAILARWHAAALPRGTALTLSEGPHAGLTGRFDGLERDGSLALLMADGRRLIVHAGDVSLAI
jgi:BirA family transcriptional regulator, biotin operon repressor / biotin---[acetyl-CoA-carboxylase] ligase